MTKGVKEEMMDYVIKLLAWGAASLMSLPVEYPWGRVKYSFSSLHRGLLLVRIRSLEARSNHSFLSETDGEFFQNGL